MLTMRPRPCAFMTGATAFIRRIGPVRLTAMILSHTAIVRLSRSGNGIAMLYAASLTRVELAETPGHLADHPLHGCGVGDVAGEGSGVDLVLRCQFAGDTLPLVAALRIHDGDMHALLRQRVTDALPEPAIAARHQCHRAPQLHLLLPRYESQ